MKENVKELNINEMEKVAGGNQTDDVTLTFTEIPGVGTIIM